MKIGHCGPPKDELGRWPKKALELIGGNQQASQRCRSLVSELITEFAALSKYSTVSTLMRVFELRKTGKYRIPLLGADDFQNRFRLGLEGTPHQKLERFLIGHVAAGHFASFLGVRVDGASLAIPVAAPSNRRKPHRCYNAFMNIDPSQIELSPEQRASLAQLAEKTGKPWPEVLSEALRSYRPANGVGNTQGTSKSFYDVMNVDGVIGIVKDAPADLSTNPRHMEGFGRGLSGSD